MADIQPQDPELKFAIDLARLADQTRCHNVVLLDVRQKSPVTKYYLIATGTSDRQRRTVGDELIAHGKQNGFPAWRSNGYETAKWIVVDFVDVVAHVFEEASRNFYDLEMLWGDCPRIQWKLPGQEVSAPAISPPAVSESPLEIADDLQEAMLAADAIVDAVSEPEVEEFVDEELFVTHVTDNSGRVETTSVEIIAVEPAKPRAPTPKKKPRAAVRKPAAKIAGKVTAPAKVNAKAKAKVKAPTKASAKLAGGAKRSGAKGAKAKPAAGKPPKAKKPLKAQATKPASKKTADKRVPTKKIAVSKPVTKKVAAKAAAVKSRAAVKKAPKKAAVKAKKR